MNNETEQIFIVNTSDALTAVPKLIEPVMSTQENADFSTVCRTCATVTEFVIPIFHGEGLQNNLADKIHKHLPIQVSESDVLPVAVCYQCANTLLAWHELVQCCVQADAALRARLQSGADTPESKLNSTNVIQNSEQAQQPKSQTELSSMLKNVLVEYLPSQSTACEDLDWEYVCQSCPASLSSVEALAGHVRAAHAAAATGRDALKQFINNNVTFEEMLFSDDLDRDVESDEVSPPVLPNFCCPYCESVFSSTTRLIYHLNRHAEVSLDDGMVCCKEIYKNKKVFVQHLQDAHVRRAADAADAAAAACRACGFRAADALALRAHVAEAHDNREPTATKYKSKSSPKNQKYIGAVCPECNKFFSNKYNMFAHMKKHSGTEATFSCDKCDKRFSNRGNLKQHNRLVHDGILRYPCACCGEAFATRLTRDVHARLHSGEAPYACARCGKAFRARNTLDRHLDMHIDIRKYECHLCEKKFRKSSHLKCHVRSHGRKSK